MNHLQHQIEHTEGLLHRDKHNPVLRDLLAHLERQQREREGKPEIKLWQPPPDQSIEEFADAMQFLADNLE